MLPGRSDPQDEGRQCNLNVAMFFLFKRVDRNGAAITKTRFRGGGLIFGTDYADYTVEGK